jgi:chromosome segregation ATPase
MATLAKQKAEVVRMMTDLRKLQDDLRQQPKADHRALEKTVEQLERDNAELRLQLLQKAADDNTSEIEELKAAIGALNDELQSKEQALQELELKAGPTDAALQAENELLKQLLEEKEQAIHEATLQAAAVPKTSGDLENYETELNEFRRQLEADRVKLNDEVESLRDRNKELDDAIRDMEMEMSKERAELARERMRLERLRDEVKSDAERLQREQSVRDSMAPVQKLRDQLTGKQPPAKPATERPRTMREIANPPTAAS